MSGPQDSRKYREVPSSCLACLVDVALLDETTELEEAPQILRVGAPEGDGADGEGADLQIDDGLLEELLGDNGDTALRDAGAAALRELEEHFSASYNV